MNPATSLADPAHVPLSAQSCVDLVTVHRNGLVESMELGIALVTGADGSVLAELGNSRTLIFARSALKPFQAAAALACGAPIQWDQIAVSAGSHRGTPEQCESVRSIIHKVGLDDSALQCPCATGAGNRESSDLSEAKIYHPCSGKHAAFLAACVESQWDHTRYLDLKHPLQQEVVRVIEQYAGESSPLVGTDGCGSPLPALTVAGLGRMYSALGLAAYNIQADARLATVATAMLDYPEFVEAPHRPDTVVIEDAGVVCKRGAGGVLCLATRNGVSVVIKTLGAHARAHYFVGLSLLCAAGALKAQLAQSALAKIYPGLTENSQQPYVFSESLQHVITALEHKSQASQSGGH